MSAGQPVSRVTPRYLRIALHEGTWTALQPEMWKVPPEPPKDWTGPKRDSMRVAVRAAILFLRGREWREILHTLAKLKLTSSVTKQGASLIVIKGVKFLVEYGHLVPVPPKPPKPVKPARKARVRRKSAKAS